MRHNHTFGFAVMIVVMAGCLLAKGSAQSRIMQRRALQSTADANYDKSTNTRHSHAQSPKSSHPSFFDLLSLTRFNYKPRNFAEILADSSLVVRGHITSVSEGRTLNFAYGPSNPSTTTVVEVRIDQVLKGASTSMSAYVEFIRAPAISSEQLASASPDGKQMVLYLIPAYWNYEHYKYTGAAMGRPQGAKLYTLISPQGLVMDGTADPRASSGSSSGGLVHPLEGAVPFVSADVTSLDQLTEAIQGIPAPIPMGR